MKNILVTGATGFIGQQLVRDLIRGNYSVRILVRDPKKAEQLFQNEEGIEIVVGDMEQVNDLEQACNGIDCIFHLAGYAHAWKESGLEANQKHHGINFEGTKKLFQAAVKNNVKKFIYFSSVKAVADSIKCTNEEFSELPDTPYGVAKSRAETFLLESSPQNNIHICIIRPCLVYGPNLKGNLASMLKAVDKGYFPSLPEISYYRSMIGVKDLCSAAIMAAENPNANGQIYIVNDGEQYSTNRIYRAMCHAFAKPLPKWHVPYGLLKCMANVGDIIGKMIGKRFIFDSQALHKLLGSAEYDAQKIRTQLGFVPQETFESVCPEIIKAYLKSGDSINSKKGDSSLRSE